PARHGCPRRGHDGPGAGAGPGAGRGAGRRREGAGPVFVSRRRPLTPCIPACFPYTSSREGDLDVEAFMTLRGVILAGGTGTRLGELTKVTTKHLLPVGPMPMVYHPLKKLVGAGVRDVLLVSGTEHMGDFVELLGSGRDHQCSLTYRVQDEAGGIAQ